MGGQKVKEILGKNIRFYRFRSRFSQAELAEKAGISITFLSNIERGLQFPAAETLAGLALALNAELYELFKPVGISSFDNASEKMVNMLREDITKNIALSVDNVFHEYFGGKKREG